MSRVKKNYYEQEEMAVKDWFFTSLILWSVMFILGWCISSFLISMRDPDPNAKYTVFVNKNLINEYKAAGGEMHFVGPLSYNGPDWSCGYYEPDTNDIYVNLYSGSIQSPGSILAHEMGHFVYYHSNVDFDLYDYFSSVEGSKSLFASIESSTKPGSSYFADSKELFAAQCGLYMEAMEDRGFTEQDIQWAIECCQCPKTTSYIDSIMSKYYN